MMNALHVLGVGLDFWLGVLKFNIWGYSKIVVLGEISDFGDFNKI